MKQLPLVVVSEPEAGTKAVIDRRSTGTVLFKGRESDTKYVCGACGSDLIVGLDLLKFRDVVLKCNHCKAFNSAGTLPEAAATGPRVRQQKSAS